MDQERSIETYIMLLVVLGVLMTLLFGWIVVSYEGMEGLYTTSLGREVSLMFLVFTGTILYYGYLRITRKAGTGKKEPSGHQSIFPGEERMKDPVEDTLDISLPYRQTFDICLDAVSSLTVGKIRSSDEKKGIIEGWVSSWWEETKAGDWQTPNFTMALTSLGPGKTRVHIRIITPNPFVPGDRGHSYLYDLFVLHFHVLSSENEANMERLRDVILEEAGRADGSARKDRENLPDVYFGDK
ncbi:MAG: hypothetical protein LUQ49_03480 [Methanomicrobiales archaeon]|nr:hypothetical protein [Methanomicrobiales archaeon]